MWAMHEKHDENFQSGKSTNSGVLKGSTTKEATSNDKRKVTFNTVEDKDKSDSDPEIKVNDELLKNAKAYLAKFTDFQKGGTQGS